MMAELLENTYRMCKERFGDQRAWELVKTIVFAAHGGKGVA